MQPKEPKMTNAQALQWIAMTEAEKIEFEGITARDEGKPLLSCPYPKNVHQHAWKYWQFGWHSADSYLRGA
jgi:hypothetical protein